MTGAELLGVLAMTLLASTIAVSYLADAAGFGIMPIESAIAALISTCAVAACQHRVRWRRVDVTLLGAVVIGTCAYLFWLAWPSLLPPGGGPDLTHHLLLVDYIERHGHLVHDPNAGALLGEMADYTPGVHLLAVIAGAVTGSHGFAAIFPVVAFAVAWKVGFVLLILLRLLTRMPLREPFAVTGIAMIVATSVYSISSFTHDSFLAQVVSELFAIAMWWALVWWDEQPSRSAMVLFAIAGVAAFLTWPIWIGPPVLTFAIVTLLRKDMSVRRKAGHAALGLSPVAAIAFLHIIGRAQWLSIVGTSGAVLQPSPAVLGSWLPLLALLGLVGAIGNWRYRALVVFAAAIVSQGAALWVVARASGAATPYMAIKMIYLAIYPAIVAAVVGLASGWTFLARFALRGNGADEVRMRPVAWAIVVAALVAAGHDAAARHTTTPVVSHDLWQAGRWARENVPPACVDYLVGNEHTAYWLHLAVMGNARAAPRNADNDTFLTQPAMARWLVVDGLPYAIADLAVLPVEIRGNVDLIKQYGRAAVIKRRSQTSGECVIE